MKTLEKEFIGRQHAMTRSPGTRRSLSRPGSATRREAIPEARSISPFKVSLLCVSHMLSPQPQLLMAVKCLTQQLN